MFCKIANHESKADVVYRDDEVTAFRDIHPVAPTHILIVPNRHIESINEMKPEDQPLVGHMVFTAKQLAAQEGINEEGYRLIMNTGTGRQRRGAIASARDLWRTPASRRGWTRLVRAPLAEAAKQAPAERIVEEIIPSPLAPLPKGEGKLFNPSDVSSAVPRSNASACERPSARRADRYS